MTKRELKKRTRTFERRMKKQWKHLDTPQRTAIVAGAVVQLTLFAAAQIDISRREPSEVRGSKLFWRLVCLINFIGPVMYFAFGRTSTAPTPTHEGAEQEPVVA